MNKELKHIIKIYKENRYNIISDNMIDVDRHTVTKKIRHGAELITCSCFNHMQNAKSPAFCRHKLFYLYYPILEHLDEKLSNLIGEYNAGKSIVKTEEAKELALQMMDDLENLRRLEWSI